MATLYVLKQGARIEKEYKRIIVTKHDDVLVRVPISRISQVVLVGRVGTTTPAMHSLLRSGIPLLMVSRTGKLIGRLLPPTAGNLPLRQTQFQRNEDGQFGLAFSRSIVMGKILNQKVMVQRIHRNHPEICAKRELEHFETSLEKATISKTLNSLRGIEGAAAKNYFHVFRKTLSREWEFNTRTKRPPKDPVNALLSLGYTFLSYAVMSALEVVGLDPYLGFFHSEKYGKPALALDLMEEFRVPIVDSLVLMVLNRNTLKPGDFQISASDKGVLLTKNGLSEFIEKFSHRLETKISSRELNRSISYRKLIEVQAHKLAHYIDGRELEYRPFRAR